MAQMPKRDRVFLSAFAGDAAIQKSGTSARTNRRPPLQFDSASSLHAARLLCAGQRFEVAVPEHMQPAFDENDHCGALPRNDQTETSRREAHVSPVAANVFGKSIELFAKGLRCGEVTVARGLVARKNGDESQPSPESMA